MRSENTEQGVRTVATASRVDVIIPRPTDLAALFDDHKVATLAILNHVDGCA